MTNNNHNKLSIAIIGAGISGLSCATQLQKLGYSVDIFEKSLGPSGRMSTRRTQDWSADHGAQYFTARDPLFKTEVDSWISNQVAAIWEPNLKVFEANTWRNTRNKEIRYVGTPAMNSPGKYLAKSLNIHFNQTITSVAQKNNYWILNSTESGEISKKFDWVIFALPAPQTASLASGLHKDIDSITTIANMKGCWTLMLQFNEKPEVNFDAAFINSDIISWVCRNNSKPGRSGKESWTIHTNPNWSQDHIESSKEEISELITKFAYQIGLDCSQAEIAIHRWRYANGYIDSPIQFHLQEGLKIGICGDWLHGGRVEGAWLSGFKIAEKINSLS